MIKASSSKGLRHIKEIIPSVMEKIQKPRRKKADQPEAPKSMRHDACMIKDQLLAIRRQVCECLSVHVDNAKKKFPLDDDSLILKRVETGLENVYHDINIFLEGN